MRFPQQHCEFVFEHRRTGFVASQIGVEGAAELAKLLDARRIETATTGVA